MDGHSRYPPDYVALGIARLARGDTRWVSGPSVPVGDNAVSRAIALALRGPLGRGGSLKWSHAADARGGDFELDSGVFAGVWERATLLGYQGWDEGWDCNEDSELAGRFLARGETLVCMPAMAAEYAPRHTLRGLWRQYHRYGTERAHTAARHPHTVRKSQVLPPGRGSRPDRGGTRSPPPSTARAPRPSRVRRRARRCRGHGAPGGPRTGRAARPGRAGDHARRARQRLASISDHPPGGDRRDSSQSAPERAGKRAGSKRSRRFQPVAATLTDSAPGSSGALPRRNAASLAHSDSSVCSATQLSDCSRS